MDNPKEIVRDTDEIPLEVQEMAIELLRRVDEYWTRGYKPSVAAGTAVYVAGICTLNKIPQREIRRLFGISTISITKHHPRFFEVADQEDLEGNPHLKSP